MKVSKQRAFSGYFNLVLAGFDFYMAATHPNLWVMWTIIGALTLAWSLWAFKTAKVLEQKGR